MSFKDFRIKARIWILALLGAGVIKLISATLRWKQVGEIHPSIVNSNDPIIFVFWHDRELMIHNFLKQTGRVKISPGLCAIASMHPDGRIIAGILERLGFTTVAGSSSRGGFSAVRALTKLVNARGLDCGIAADGPKGPRHFLKDGVVKISQLTAGRIVAVSYSAERRWVFGSWDRMFLPKPFSRAVYAASQPLYIPRDAVDEDFRAAVNMVEQALREVTAKVESYEYA